MSRDDPTQPKVCEANGVALCPNLHRAFDRHLFWIDADYRVRRFEGQALRLPHRPEWWLGREIMAAQYG